MTHADPRSTALLFEARALGHRFGRLRVLDGVDLALAPGERVALRGANGAGKTTLLRIVAGLLRPQRGTVARGIGRDGAPRDVGARIAFVGQSPQAYPELTAFENLRLFARLYGLDDPAAAATAALAAFDLADRPRLRARQLSRGQQQRLALARAFMAEPDLMVLDEPWTALDAAGGDRLDAAIRAASARGAAVLFAVHGDAHAALAHRTITIAGGRIEGGGLPASGLVTHGGHETSTSGTVADAASDAFRAGAPDRRAVGLWRGACWILGKDVLAELRAREILPAVAVFAMLCATVLAYAVGGAMSDLPRVAPGAYWVALLFGGTLGLGRMMAAEVDGDALSALRLTRLDPGALFIGKWAAATAFALLVAAALAPAFVALFALRPLDALGLIAVACVALPGWAAAGVLVAGVSATVRGREAVLPILLFPLLLPLVTAAVQATSGVLGDAALTAFGPPLVLLAAYDVIFCVVGFWLFPLVIEST
ncbi:MAG: heme ABC exporter ATP-binding protein CcmA [Ardenticatenales bacterium]